MAAGKWTPDRVRLWWLLAKEITVAVLGAFLFVFGALHANELGLAILGCVFFFGGVLLGIPVAYLLARNGRHGDDT